VENSRGLAMGDLDNDGRPDLLVTNEGGAPRLLLNRMPPKGKFLTLTLLDSRGHVALGARAEFSTPSGFRGHRVCRVSYSYLVSNDARVHCGFPDTDSQADARIFWPDGKQELFSGLELNRFATLRQGTGKPEAVSPRPLP
jgi:hypothetical protein